MMRKLLESLLSSSLVTKIMSRPSPRWIVFGVDMLIVLVSTLLVINLNNGNNLPPKILNHITIRLAAICLVYGIVMILLHTYRYVARFSVIEDIYRIFALVVISSAVLLANSLICYWTVGYSWIRFWNIFVIGVLAFGLMMCARLAVKYIYLLISRLPVKRARVVVLGANINSFAFATQLNSEAGGSYKVVALLTLSPENNGNKFNDIPLHTYDADSVADIFDRYSAEALIFPSSQLKLMRTGMADVFLRHNIKLLMYNGVAEFDENGKSASRSVRGIRIEDLLGRDVIQPDTTDVEQVIRHQVVMITGAAGSIGSEIVNQVASLGAEEIVLIDQAETPMHDLQLFMQANHPDTKIHLIIGDITNHGRMEQAFMRYRPRYVFHAAAYKHVPMMEQNPSEAILTNVFGTKNIADLSVKYGVEKFVMVSTDKAVNPTNVMGCSKRIAEIYVQSLFFHQQGASDKPSTRFITTRFGNVLGSNGSVIPLFRRQIEEGGPVTLTHRDIIRYFMTIPEACSLVLQAGTMGHGGEIYIFDMGQPVKIYDLATRMISLSGLRPGIDIKIIETGLRPGEKLYEELLNDKETTLATSNNKIMIAKVRTYHYDEVMEHIEQLRQHTLAGNYHDIVAEMKHIVPEYKSQNSQWESVDKEISSENHKSELQSVDK